MSKVKCEALSSLQSFIVTKWLKQNHSIKTKQNLCKKIQLKFTKTDIRNYN